MRRAALLCLPLLALSACGGGDSDSAADAPTSSASSTAAATTTPAADGTQAYRSPGELVDALAEASIACVDLEATTSLYAAAQARCYTLGQETVLQLWLTSADRDARVTEQVGLLGSADIDYCYVLGRGTTGTWSVNAGNPDNCADIAAALGGDQLSS